MKNPETFYSHHTPWDDWVVTIEGKRKDELIYGWDVLDKTRERERVEFVYPGFLSVFDTVRAMGADEYFVTFVLKFCIVEVNDANLMTVLAAQGRLETIKSAIAVGMSGEEVIALLRDGLSGIATREVPDTLGFRQ